jgi:hypothetical protein
LNDIQVPSPVESQLKMRNVEGDQAPTTENVEKILQLIHEDRRRTIHELADTAGISF